jgi:hypothetical protein
MRSSIAHSEHLKTLENLESKNWPQGFGMENTGKASGTRALPLAPGCTNAEIAC